MFLSICCYLASSVSGVRQVSNLPTASLRLELVEILLSYLFLILNSKDHSTLPVGLIAPGTTILGQRHLHNLCGSLLNLFRPLHNLVVRQRHDPNVHRIANVDVMPLLMPQLVLSHRDSFILPYGLLWSNGLSSLNIPSITRILSPQELLSCRGL